MGVEDGHSTLSAHSLPIDPSCPQTPKDSSDPQLCFPSRVGADWASNASNSAAQSIKTERTWAWSPSQRAGLRASSRHLPLGRKALCCTVSVSLVSLSLLTWVPTLKPGSSVKVNAGGPSPQDPGEQALSHPGVWPDVWQESSSRRMRERRDQRELLE